MPLSAGAVEFGFTGKMILHFTEYRQDIAPTPAGESQLTPVVVIRRLPTHIDHGVDSRRTAQHLAARIGNIAAVQPGIGFGAKHPVGAWIADREEIANRYVKPDPAITPTRFDQRYPVARIGRKPISQHTTRRTCADNHVIKAVHCRAE